MRVLKGRTFTDADEEQAPKVAVINEALARHMWPGENPIGRQLPMMGNKVVGVVADTRHEGLSADIESEIYVPLLQQEGIPGMQLAVRTAADPISLISAVRTEIAAVDPLPAFSMAFGLLTPRHLPWSLWRSSPCHCWPATFPRAARPKSIPWWP